MERAWMLPALTLVALLPVATAHGMEDGHPEHPMFDSGMMENGMMWSMTFDDVGTFAYHCTPHPWMLGNVTVMAASGAPTTHEVRIVEDGSTWGYEPSELTVRAGDTVRWTNDGTYAHTVTSLDEAVDDDKDSPGPGAAALLGILGLALLVAVARRC